VIAGWILGLLVDLGSDARLGLFALSFAMAAIVVVRFRELFFRNHVLSYASVTLLFAGIVHGILGIYRTRAFPEAGSGWSVMVWEPVLTALYAGVWSVPAFYVLRGLSPWMGLRFGKARRI
jgi:rod shape-determining protein MreD